MHSGGKQIDRSASHPSCSSSCVKIYLCSNPEDSVVERRALRENVFPRFREHCRHSLGLEVRVIDPFESSDPRHWPDESSRQQLIQECRENSAGPFLLALVGHQYGPASLATQVEVSEYQLLLQESQQAGVSTQELEKVYQRDESSVPASYCLRPPRRYTFSLQTEVKEEEQNKTEAKDAELRKVFQTAVSLCVHSDLMTPEKAKGYYRSALDADLRFALDNRPDNNMVRRCLVYVHKVINARGERDKSETNLQLQPKSEFETSDQAALRKTPTSDELLSELRDVFLPALVTSSKLLVYATTTECDRRHGYTTTRRRGYVERLCQQVYSDLVGLMDDLNISEDCDLGDALSREEAEQKELCDILARFYDVHQPEEEKVRAYVEQRDQQRPLVVMGGPCTGKTVLLAHCTQQIKSWLSDSDPVVIGYFCNLSINTSPKHLLSSLCYQIVCRYHTDSSSKQDPSFNPSADPDSLRCITNPREDKTSCSPTSVLDSHHEPTKEQNLNISCPDPRGFTSDIIKPDVCLSELKEHLSSLFTLLPSTKRPLILFLDGLDQLENNFGPQIIKSLPSSLPPGVKLILTVSSNRKHLLQVIKLHYPQGGPPQCVSEGDGEVSGYVCVQLGLVDRKQCVKMLTSLLRGSGRRVTSGQQALVNQALTSCCLPLYARLLHAHASLWHSDSDVTESSLPDGIHSSISFLLDHLEQIHGSTLMARAVSYLTLSRTGLSEVELVDLLSSQDEVLAEHVCPSEGAQSKMRIPQVDVERLLLDLKGFLMKRKVADSQVLFWVSRHFKLVVAKRYLGSHEVRRKIHSEMVDYFSGRWACGSEEPLLVNQTSRLNKALNVDTDRQPTSQPFVFPSSKDVGRVNMRKVLELPYHLEQSGRWEELEQGLLMSLGFHQAMVQAGLLGDLVAMLEPDEGSFPYQFLRERLLLASTLKSSACFLQSSPLQLLTVMETSLLPYLDVFPALECYVREIRKERRCRERGLGTAICPSPSTVLPVQYIKCYNKTKDACVTETAATECGIVAETLDDGSAWILSDSGRDIVKLSLSCKQEELKFAGVKSSNQFLLLSTQCNKLFVWDVAGPEMLVEVKAHLKKDFECSQTPNKIEGFAACQKKLFLWWKDESFVSVFDMSSETLTHFQCQGSVTCLALSSDGFFMFCGRDEGTVSIFDIKAGSLLGTCSNSNHSAVTSIILCEDKREMACIDRNGNVSLWDVAAKLQPPRLVKENFNRGESNNILSMDHSEEINTLLVCQANQVSLWDTCNWELWDQFLAPKGKAFTQAVLSQDGHLFLALLDTCSLVLVWMVSTGECVLSLETTKQPRTLFRMSSDVICVHQNGCLTAWDSEMIDAAGTAPKMGCGVKEVVVEKTGAWFYTADGSETVWRWSSDTGFPHDSFLHDSPVEKVQLSLNSIHLVSLSAGDIYVWLTETGENVVRISGSRATNILIAPNSKIGVSISKRGLSRVWKMAHGGIVCSIHPYLSDAQVSPESTYLIGRCDGDLLAASLWSGSISKRFSCVESSEQVIAFQTLTEHPDFVVVMAASGAVYTWKVAEETVCRHFQLPYTFHCQPQDFQMSSDGSYALLSTDNGTINLLDLSQVRLCSFKAEGPVIKACLDKTGCYAAYVSLPPILENSCTCYLHAKPVLTVTRLSDGERIGSVRLSKNPLTVVYEWQCVFVGFEDGSVGVYSVSDDVIDGEELVSNRESLNGQMKQCPFDRASFSWFPRASPNITWP
ncbi:leucine-rich repeat and WD repeat-containing protein KIAA1239 [Stegastes partitus]|uniref:Leucine-rich repeat and WD repeat-containing protein KIAA1239 n=2 Tax=Stegastes partitus TaxID=144197 RepID=A0A9Y4JYM0_9TELE|nr:PREDICTED: leucine-rich repeat and WD repeat-containing protein KIAA1239-like [Stegastes partitus]